MEGSFCTIHSCLYRVHPVRVIADDVARVLRPITTYMYICTMELLNLEKKNRGKRKLESWILELGHCTTNAFRTWK